MTRPIHPNQLRSIMRGGHIWTKPETYQGEYVRREFEQWSAIQRMREDAKRPHVSEGAWWLIAAVVIALVVFTIFAPAIDAVLS